MDKKRIIGIVALILAAVLLLGLFGQSENPIANEVTLERMYRGNEPTGEGYIGVSFTGEDPAYRFINIALTLDGRSEWVVRNFGVDVSASAAVTRYPGKLPSGFSDDLTNIPVVAVVSEKPLENWDGTLKRQVGIETTIAEVGKRDSEKGFARDGDTQKETGWGMLTRPVFASDSTANEPAGSRFRIDDPQPDQTNPSYVNMQLDGVSDTPQEFNECAPTAASNALDWLADVHDVEDQMPTDTEGTIDELKADMQWDGGTAPGDSLRGIQNFLSRRGLPFAAHQLDPSDNLFWDMVEEMRNGQILLVSLQYYAKDENGEWERDGAHLATVVGLSGGNVGGVSSTFVHLHDSGDVEQEASRDIREIRGDEFVEYSDDTRTEVRYAIAISPTYAEDGETLIFTGGVVPGGTIAEDRPVRSMTHGLSAFGFFTVSVDPIGDQFVGSSFEASALVIKNEGASQTIRWDGASFTVEAENPWGISGEVRGAGPISPAVHTNHPPQTGGLTGRSYSIRATFTCDAEGAASVTFAPTLSWPAYEGDVPEAIANDADYAAQLIPSDTVAITSPPFNCILTPMMQQVEDERTAIDRLESFCPGVDTTAEDGRQIGVYKGPNNECYPDFQFRVAGPDNCEADHYHGAMGDIVYSLTGVSWADPAKSSCGFGVEGSLEQETVTVSQEILTMYLGDAFLGE